MTMQARKPREPVPLTERIEAARRNRKRFIKDRNLLLAVVSRLWPSHVSAPARQRLHGAFVVCVHSPAGQLAFNVTPDEREGVFAHLDDAPNDWDGHTTAQRDERLDDLARLGWLS